MNLYGRENRAKILYFIKKTLPINGSGICFFFSLIFFRGQIKELFKVFVENHFPFFFG